MFHLSVLSKLSLLLSLLGFSSANALALPTPMSPDKMASSQPSAVLQLAPAISGSSEITGELTCDASPSACSDAIKKAQLCIVNAGNTGRLSCVPRPFASTVDENGRWRLRFSGEPLQAGDSAWLTLAGQPSNTVHAFPSANDVAVLPDCGRKTVSVYFPGRAQIELRLTHASRLKRVPWISATAADSTATFNADVVFEQGDQLQAVATIGEERHTYDPIPAACPSGSAVVAAVPPTPNKKVASEQPASPTAAPVVFNPKEGDSVVQGYAKGYDKVELEFLEGHRSDGDEPAPTIVKSQVAVDNASGQFTYKLPQPLAAGQEIKALGVFSQKPAAPVADTSTDVAAAAPSQPPAPAAQDAKLITVRNYIAAPAGGVAPKQPPPAAAQSSLVVAPSDLEWGRVRGYFTLGVVLSQRANDFNANNASPFLDYTVDKNWLSWKPAAGGAGNSVRPLQHWGGLRFNTFFDARLTAIPTAGVSGSAAATAPTLTPSTVILSRQAASLQVGAYLPIVADRWAYKGQDYSLFVAPLAKTGFYTPTDTSSVSNNASTATANPATPARFYDFFGYGVRIGHSQDYYRRDRADSYSRSLAPEILSYLDISVAKYANFEDVNAACFTAAAGCVRQRLWRYAFEGMLKIPHTPLIFGMSANLAAERSHTKGMLAPQDDLRFLFGAKFDAQKLMRSLFTPGN